MSGRAVRVSPAVVRGQQIPQGGEQVLVAARPGLHDRDPGGGMRNEDVEQAVAPSRGVGQEAFALDGEVQDGFCPASGDGENVGAHR